MFLNSPSELCFNSKTFYKRFCIRKPVESAIQSHFTFLFFSFFSLYLALEFLVTILT